jgi:hypothetical protein
MAQTILTPDILEGLQTDKISEYLQSNGWQIENRIGDKATVWERGDYEVVLPLRKELRDYVARLLDLLETLQEVENRSKLDILSELINASQISSLMGREVVKFSLTFPGIYGSEAPIRKLSDILCSLQKTIDQFGKIKTIQKNTSRENFDNEAKRLQDVPLKKQALEELELTAFGYFEGSFGLKIASNPMSLVTPSIIPDAIKELYDLILMGDQIEDIQERLLELKITSARRYTDFLKSLKRAKTDLQIEWGSVKPGYGGIARLSYSTAENALSLINNIRSEEITVFTTEGRLIEGHTETRHFVFRNQSNEEEYSGYIAKDAMPRSGQLNLTRCSVVMEKRKYSYFVTNKVETTYTITELDYTITDLDPVT